MIAKKGADYWHERAEQARTLARTYADPAARAAMNSLAESYDLLARIAARNETKEE